MTSQSQVGKLTIPLFYSTYQQIHECYKLNPSTNGWEKISPMKPWTNGLSAVQLDQDSFWVTGTTEIMLTMLICTGIEALYKFGVKSTQYYDLGQKICQSLHVCSPGLG